MRTRTIAVVVATALGAAACAGSTEPGTGTGANDLVAAWVLETAEPPLEVPDGARITLTIEDDGGTLRAGGRAACNQYGGTLDASDGAWRLDDLAVTEMGCEQPLMAAEAAYLDALLRIDGWSVDGDVLVLSGRDVELRFARLAPVESAALTGTTWVLDGLLQGSGPDAAMSSTTVGVDPAVLRLDADGTFTLFSGCRDFAGDWTTSGDLVVFPSWGETTDSRGVAANGDLTCGDDAIALEQTVIAVLESEFTPTLAERRLTVQRGDVGLVFRAGEDAG